MNKEIPEYTYCEEARKKAMSDWRDRYRATFRSDGMFCNWLKMTWNYKPVTPKHLKEYEHQKALIEEFELYKGVYDGLGSDHEYYGNQGEYWKIFCEEREKIYSKQSGVRQLRIKAAARISQRRATTKACHRSSIT